MSNKIIFYINSILCLIIICTAAFSCGGGGEKSDGVHFDFYFDKNIFQSEKIPADLISLCYPYEREICIEAALKALNLGDETKLIALHPEENKVAEHLILKRNAAEKLAGAVFDKTYIDNKLKNTFELPETFNSTEEVQLTKSDIELSLTDRGLGPNDPVFFFSEYSSESTVELLGHYFPVFHTIEELRDSIAARMCDKAPERVSVFYELSMLSSGLAENCDCPEEEIGKNVCGDGIPYRCRTKAVCAGAIDIVEGPCEVIMTDFEIPPLDKDLLKEEAKGFVNTFYDYINEISKGVDHRDAAKKLFIDNGKDVTVEISNKGSDLIKTYSLTAYLNYFYNLQNINQEVKIDISSIEMDDAFESMMDGDFPMHKNKARIEQEYNKYQKFDSKMGKLLYSDNTGKGVEFIARLAESPGSGKLEWRVYLSKITVERNAI